MYIPRFTACVTLIMRNKEIVFSRFIIQRGSSVLLHIDPVANISDHTLQDISTMGRLCRINNIKTYIVCVEYISETVSSYITDQKYDIHPLT